MEDKPDFKKSYILANEMLVASVCIKTFPFDARQFVKEQTDLKFCSFKKAFEKYGVPYECFGSDSACLSRNNGKNILFYNQDEWNIRDSFNVLHETGHFLMNHETNLEKDDHVYGKQEVETNYFTAQMLMPMQVLKEIQRRGYKVCESFIVKHFGVSYSAAKKRMATLNKKSFFTADEKIFDDIILKKYAVFINRIAPKKHEYSCSCWDDPMQKERDSWL